MRKPSAAILVLAALLLLAAPALAQGAVAPWIDVFLAQDPATGAAQIYFVDALTGLSTMAYIEGGTDFTLAGDAVLYRKTQNGAVMRIRSSGAIEPHPFIHHTPDLRATRWVVSPDHRAIAWVQIAADGATRATIAQADGSSLRDVPVDAPTPPLEIAPVALTDGMTRFYFDAAHTAEVDAGGPYRTYAEIHEYNLASGTFRTLPGEPGCACGAAVTPDGTVFARLQGSSGSGPFNVRVWDLRAEVGYAAPAPGLPYPFAGDLVLNAAGTLAAYSITSSPPGAEDDPPQQHALMFVDIGAGQQVLALPPGPTAYRPLRFIDEDSALLLAVANGSTYKLNLNNGDLTRVSDHLYLGTILAAP